MADDDAEEKTMLYIAMSFEGSARLVWGNWQGYYYYYYDYESYADQLCIHAVLKPSIHAGKPDRSKNPHLTLLYTH